MNLKKIGKVFTSKFVGTGPSSYEKGICRAAVSQRLSNTDIEYWWNDADRGKPTSPLNTTAKSRRMCVVLFTLFEGKRNKRFGCICCLRLQGLP